MSQEVTDKEILDWLADNLAVEGIVGVDEDVHVYATACAPDASTDEEIAESYRKGFRAMVSDAIRKEKENA